MRHALASAIGTVAAIAVTTPLAAQQRPARFDLAAQPLATSIQAVSVATGTSIVAPAEIVEGRLAPALTGRFSPEAAVARLLRGSGLVWARDGATIVIARGNQNRVAIDAGPSEADTGDVVVTGSRIRGAPVASPVIRLDPEGLRSAGLATLGEAIRTVPQNFGGGQNPGIGLNVPEGNGGDVGGGASLNLRGLGSDATLTLLNGRRLSYSAARQSIDVSAIPLGAVERIEIVPDGASALFGSDAVAGVANIVLRRDADGLETRARIGAATDGGFVDQLYAVTAGRTWGTGGALVAYEYGDSTDIEARQRSYAAGRSPGLTLYPSLRRHSALVTGHQRLTDRLTLAVDALYNRRPSDLTFPLNDEGDLAVSRARTFTLEEAWAVVPSLRLRLPADWLVDLSGSYGWNRVDYGGDLVFGDETIDAGSGYYRNQQRNVELSGNGTLLALPAGPAKLAVGAGYRENLFLRFTGEGGRENIERDQESYYGFGELALPLVSAAMGVRFVERLNVSAALRYERYPGVGEVTTPKLGLIYAPVDEVELKGSWGRSFRAPTLYQQYQPRTVYLLAARSLGGGDLAAGSTALLLLGGNPALRPERSTNWSATVALRPRAWPGAELELGYFNVRYRDRIVSPIPFLSTALSNPIYADFVTRSPSVTTQTAALDSAATFINTITAGYDAAAVAAIVDGSSINAGQQRVDGIDVLARQRFDLGGSALAMSLNASYLDSDQQIGNGTPVTPLAGVLFNPPNWRGRGELGWTRGGFTATGALTYIGPVRDTRAAAPVRVPGMTPIDLTLRYRTPAGGLLGGVDLIASAQNLLNDKPSVIATSLPTDAPYDSTNYSPIGRFLSLTVAKAW